MGEREKFGSRLGFILVSAGCAVGLGNVWKFPYVTGQFGGAGFILIYLVFLAILGIPIMVCEFSVGRGSQKSVASSFRVLQPKGAVTHKYGYLGMLGNYMLMMFYTMVAGWTLYYLSKMVRGSLKGMGPDEIGADFGAMLGSAGTMTFWMIVAVLIAFGVCSLGLRNGVEKITKVMMIALLALMIIMCIRAVTLPGAGEGLRFYLV
ncbi:MAG: sodium-dependent transporter, partial [Anaerovoracaceae bacterium]